ncbi:rifin PIR protein, putative [Plasmodium reichenowi]|uniref:Rifin PIR protein, putative n=1 Tax=Plasmodium reichenowi TaxID=5854 RepID=A0A2P9DSV3_PLARE|nr:rifin PIR protein, putative [Plasmodium reichenowi]
MKVHYINILLFALPLNILEHNQRNHNITPHYTPKIPTTRLLCECELYAPANYDNDPQMKEVMQQFEDRTSQRFHEYDDRMVEKRKQCKDKCDKEIEKIILKDKLEKELMDKFATLQTDIQSDAIPTCVCEKSIADKMEKFCLNCGMNVGGVVTLSSGVLGGIAEGAISVLQPLAITAAENAAKDAATALATQAGMDAVKLKIKGLRAAFLDSEGFVDLISIVKETTYKNGDALVDAAKKVIGNACMKKDGSLTSFYNSITIKGDSYIGNFAQDGATAYQTTLTTKTPALTKAKVGVVEATYSSYEITIIASIIAIVVIVLIMIIIYLILRHRRKKKMKKKLQYIKLLEE